MSDESLIEAVARIIDPAAFGSGDDNPTFRHEQPRLKAYARGKAKAAIKAHTEWLESKGLVVVPKEPTDQMMLEVLRLSGERYDEKFQGTGPLRWHYQAMLTAAQQEESEG